MTRVLIQAGHYPDGGGAPGESDWAFDCAQLLAAHLQTAGIETAIVGDWLGRAPPAEVRQDAGLFVALHYDGAVYGPGRNSGCFADRAVDETQAAAADRFIEVWETLYPTATGIPLRNERRNPRTTHYYAFRALTWATPGVLLEHGCGAPVGTGGYPPGDDAAFLHEHLETVAELDAQAVLAFLDVLLPSDTGGVGDETAELGALTDDERALLDTMRSLGAGISSLEAWLSGLGRAAELGRELRDARRLPTRRRKQIGAELARLGD